MIRSTLLSAPGWWKRWTRWTTGQAGREYQILYGFGELAYEDADRSVVLFAERLMADPERILSRRTCYVLRDGVPQAVDDESWELIKTRVSADLTARGISWAIEE